MEITAAAATHVGRVRDSNEDALHAGSMLYAVADGLGGHPAGEVASAIAVQTVARLEQGEVRGDVEQVRTALVEVVQGANRAIHDDGRRHPERSGMGTTLTVATIVDAALLLAHVGDSRAYLLRDGEAQQLTEDHATGPFTLTRVVVLDPEVEVDSYGPTPLQAGDVVVLCSDGLTAVVEGDELPALVAGRDPDDGANALVAETLARGAPDNVAVVVIAIR